MTPMAYEYVASGAADEHTVRWNRDAFDRIRLRPRMLRDVASVDTRVTLLGREHAFPILLAPTAYHRVLHPDGEIATARGAAAAGITWIVSVGTTTPIQEIAAAAAAPRWFQLYFQSDRAFTRDLVQQVEASGCEVLCLTVDSPILGPRNRQARAGFKLPPEISTPHLYDIGHRKQAVMDPRRVAATWQDVEWLRGVHQLPLVLKGILDPGDADLGDRIRGGRHRRLEPRRPQPRYRRRGIDALPDIVERVRGRVPVLVDGGVRRGTDIVKAVALGATAVLIGRPYCYGLSVGGSEGVRRVVEILRAELEAAMMLTGVARLVRDRTVVALLEFERQPLVQERYRRSGGKEEFLFRSQNRRSA